MGWSQKEFSPRRRRPILDGFISSRWQTKSRAAWKCWPLSFECEFWITNWLVFWLKWWTLLSKSSWTPTTKENYHACRSSAELSISLLRSKLHPILFFARVEDKVYIRHTQFHLNKYYILSPIVQPRERFELVNGCLLFFNGRTVATGIW